MHTPKNQTSNDRESAAQMGAEAKTKAELMLDGAIETQKRQLKLGEGEYDRHRAEYGAGHWLALVIEDLTGSNQTRKEWATAEVERLVQLGREMALESMGYDLDELENDNPHNRWMKEE